MESNRQKKISVLIKKDVSKILDEHFRNKYRSNLLISVTKVKTSPDLSLSKIYLSIFPSIHAGKILIEINSNKGHFKHLLSSLIKNQIRVIPSINFKIDDSLDYIEKIETALKAGENPIKGNNESK